VFSDQVRLQIENHAQRLLGNSPLFARARAGQITTHVVHAYLRSLHYLLSSTTLQLSLGLRRAIESGNPDLVAYFEEKQREEIGHEEWAASDMRRLAQCFGDLTPVSPAPSIVALCRFVEGVIDEDPRFYVVYALCAEYVTVLLGPAWIDALTRGCGVPVSALTAVSKHVEADAEHANEGFVALERFVGEPEFPVRLRTRHAR
jgi:hypothetical protein